MDLTALRVRDARREIAAVDAADITNPDLPHLVAVRLITRMKVSLDILTDHAERQQTALDRLQEDKYRLQSEVTRLQVELGNREDQDAAALPETAEEE